jgi:hypothetical protein
MTGILHGLIGSLVGGGSVVEYIGFVSDNGGDFDYSATGWLETDFLVAIISNGTEGIGSVPGWENLVEVGASPYFEVHYRFKGTSTSLNVNSDQYPTTIIACFRNVNTTTPIDVIPTTSSGSTGDPNPPSITTVTNGAMLLAAAGVDDDSINTVTDPTGFTHIKSQTSGGTTFYRSAVVASYKSQLVAGTVDPSTYTLDSDDSWRAATVALRPA